MAVTVADLKEARRKLGWSRVKLAKAAGISPSTVYKAECIGVPLPAEWALRAMREAMERAGVKFAGRNRGAA